MERLLIGQEVLVGNPCAVLEIVFLVEQLSTCACFLQPVSLFLFLSYRREELFIGIVLSFFGFW